MRHPAGNAGIRLLVIIVVIATAAGGYVTYQDRYRKDTNFRWKVRKWEKAWKIQQAKLQEMWENVTGPIKLSKEDQDRMDAAHEGTLRTMAGSMNAAARRRSGASPMMGGPGMGGPEEVPGPKEVPASHRGDYQSSGDYQKTNDNSTDGYAGSSLD